MIIIKKFKEREGCNMSEFFRRMEKKYIITKKQYLILKDIIEDNMVQDEHGKSTICNIYFDTSGFDLIRHSITKPIYKDKVIALEIDKTDFLSFGDKTMISTTSNEVKRLIMKLNQASIILIDLNNTAQKNICTSIIYLIEPSTIKLNNLMRRNKVIISTLKEKQIMLNKSLLTPKEVSEFEFESGIKVIYNMPPLNDRKRNAVIAEFLRVLHLIGNENHGGSTSKIFGLFRK